jgi:hypothetical protein
MIHSIIFNYELSRRIIWCKRGKSLSLLTQARTAFERARLFITDDEESLIERGGKLADDLYASELWNQYGTTTPSKKALCKLEDWSVEEAMRQLPGYKEALYKFTDLVSFD